MIGKKLIAALLCAVMVCAVFAGCTEQPAVTTDAETTTGAGEITTEPISTDTEPADTENGSLTPKDPGYVIPDENLSGKNESANPLEDDGNGEAIFNRLMKSEYLKNPDAKLTDNVSRSAFAYDVIFYAGFTPQQAIYICMNDYTDMDKFSAEMRRAEIAVNQGYMLKPAGTEFKPDGDITYGEVLRGLLYVLGYREYADKYGVAKLAAEIGLSNYIDLSKKNSETVTYSEYVQLVSNALRQTLVVCVTKGDQMYTVSRGSEYNIETAYIKNKPNESDSLFRIANSGWDIYPGGGYRYGPSMIINEDGTIDCWLASNSGVNGEIDWGKYRKSYDNGFTWTQDTGSVRPTSASEDWNWSCDPGVIKIGDYYYAAYTTILWHDGVDNNTFIARSKTPEGEFVEKWCGNGWTGDPKPVVTYDGQKSNWGSGEGSMVVVGDTLYLYVSWNDNTGDYTKVYTADATREDWPATLKFRGTAYKHNSAEDSADVKFVDAYNCFISVATASRFSDDCYIDVMTSYDGIFFRHEVNLKHKTANSNIMTCIHNMGITGNALGHIDIFNTQQYVGYAYQPPGYSWANWKTRLSPIVFLGTDNYDHTENVISRDANDNNVLDSAHTPAVVQFRLASASGGRTIHVTDKSKTYKFTVTTMNKKAQENKASAAVKSEIEYIYDSTKLELDKSTLSVKLLTDEVVRLYAKYGDLMAELAIVPDYLDRTKPVEFYPEVDTVTFYYRNEVKQPAFIARSASNEYLMLWRGISSYTDAQTKDIPDALKKWDQKCEYSGYDENIVKIDANGKMTAVSVGETTVTATYMGFTAALKVVVAKLR